MSKPSPTILRLPVYPWLLGAFPILHLYAANFGAVIDIEVPICIFWVMTAITVAYISINALLRNRHETAAIVSIIVIGFSLSGHLHTLLFESEFLVVWSLAVLLCIALAIAALHKLRPQLGLGQAAIPLNLISTALLVLQAATLAGHYAESYNQQLARSFGNDALAARQSSAKVHDSAERPDVYYIIPDGYASNAWNQSEINFDNSSFTEALSARGFNVVLHAQSNYGTTLPSLASTLNMRYFASNPTELHDVDYLRLSIAESDVAKYLQQLGYTYVQFLSGYLFPSSIADINRDFTPNGTVDVITEEDLSATLWDTMQDSKTSADVRRFYQQSFVSLYIETTLLKLFDDELRKVLEGYLTGPYDGASPRRFLATVDEVASVVSMQEATFTVIHMFEPHRPLFFDEDGIIDKISNPSDQEFIAGLNFVNARFLDMIDAILEGSRHEPVIIFQADHGSSKGEVRTAQWRPIHFDVFSAYYLPDRFTIEIPRPHTNINTFPLILNAVFNADFALKENRLFELKKSNSKPFAQEDVTEDYARR